jgi:hypothetical protein
MYCKKFGRAVAIAAPVARFPTLPRKHRRLSASRATRWRGTCCETSWRRPRRSSILTPGGGLNENRSESARIVCAQLSSPLFGVDVLVGYGTYLLHQAVIPAARCVGRSCQLFPWAPWCLEKHTQQAEPRDGGNVLARRCRLPRSPLSLDIAAPSKVSPPGESMAMRRSVLLRTRAHDGPAVRRYRGAAWVAWISRPSTSSCARRCCWICCTSSSVALASS